MNTICTALEMWKDEKCGPVEEYSSFNIEVKLFCCVYFI